jgi:hypothetical protein
MHDAVRQQPSSCRNYLSMPPMPYEASLAHSPLPAAAVFLAVAGVLTCLAFFFILLSYFCLRLGGRLRGNGPEGRHGEEGAKQSSLGGSQKTRRRCRWASRILGPAKAQGMPLCATCFEGHAKLPLVQ